MDAWDFDQVVRRYSAALARLASGYAGRASDRDELLQDILVALWRALPSFRGESSERTFVFRVAHNRGLTFAARRPRDETLADWEYVADPRPLPDVEVDQVLRRERLMAAIRQLPELQRQAVMLHLEGFPAAEIARLQGTTENNAAVRLTRARQRLRTLLGEEDR